MVGRSSGRPSARPLNSSIKMTLLQRGHLNSRFFGIFARDSLLPPHRFSFPPSSIRESDYFPEIFQHRLFTMPLRSVTVFRSTVILPWSAARGWRPKKPMS